MFNNQRLESASEFQASVWMSKRSCSYSGALCKFHVIEGQNEHDQIVLYALHSFLVKIQIKAGYVRTKQA